MEFAFVAPALFLLLFVSVEFGRAVMLHQVVTDVTEDGCRRAAVSKGSTVEEIYDWTEDRLEQRGIPRSAVDSVELEAQPLTGGAFAPVTDLSDVVRGQKIRLSVTVDFASASWLPPFFIPSATKIESTVETKRE